MSTELHADDSSIFSDPARWADPDAWHAAAARVRANEPIIAVEADGYDPFFAVSRHADIMEVERNGAIFTNAPVPVLTPANTIDPTSDGPVHTLIQLDGQAHTTQRGIVADWFKPANVKTQQDNVEELAARFVDHMASLDGSCDFVTDVALHFPLQVILSILGLPEEDYPRMLKLTQELFGGDDPDIARIGEDDSLIAVVLDFVEYFAGIAADRRENPTEDLASVIANARIDEELLDDLAMLGHYLIIATAGHDTTSSAVAGGLLALLQNPDQMAALWADPELIPSATDEIIRYVSPVRHFMRTCQEPYTVGGHDFVPGDWLMLSFPSANRDEAVFDDPMAFDVQRPNGGSHIGFGFGRHYCLGTHIAKLEIRAILGEMIRRIDSIEMSADPTFVQSTLVGGPKSMPISYTMR